MKRILMRVALAGSSSIMIAPSSWAQAPTAPTAPPTCKVCVREPKTNNTRKVYTVKEEEYCLPYCNLLSLFRGHCSCQDGPCGELRVRHRLVVKKVPDCDTTQCVPKEIKP